MKGRATGFKIHIPGPYPQRVVLVGLEWGRGQSLMFQSHTPGRADAHGSGVTLWDLPQGFRLPLCNFALREHGARVNGSPLPVTTAFYLITNLRPLFLLTTSQTREPFTGTSVTTIILSNKFSSLSCGPPGTTLERRLGGLSVVEQSHCCTPWNPGRFLSLFCQGNFHFIVRL